MVPETKKGGARADPGQSRCSGCKSDSHSRTFPSGLGSIHVCLVFTNLFGLF